jgi:RHS repeat-associated protein
MTTAGNTSSFVYDGDGTRLLRRDPTAATLFLDDTELTATSSGVTATRYYTAGGATVAERTPTALTWLTADQQGSEQLAITSTGMVSRQRYLPYGAPRGTTNQLPTDRGFLGKVQDNTTGLVDLGARYYDPTIAKFVSPDPLDNNADSDTANPYSYANDNPITLSDPTGLKPAECWGSCSSKWQKSQKKRARTYHHGRYHYHLPAYHLPSHRHKTHHSTSSRPGCRSNIAGDCGESSANSWGYEYTYHEWIGPVANMGSPEHAMAAFQQNPTAIFPFPVTGCSSFTNGAYCTLHAGPTWTHGVGVVRVTAAPTSFKFTVDPITTSMPRDRPSPSASGNHMAISIYPSTAWLGSRRPPRAWG